jgi:hypothetical protein
MMIVIGLNCSGLMIELIETFDRSESCLILELRPTEVIEKKDEEG